MSHRTVREPTDAEHAELKRMKREEIGRVAVRAHIVLLSHRGHSAQEIAELHDVTDPMIYKWIGRFDEEGPSGLYDREREGRPRKIDEEVESEIERLVEGDPMEEGHNATRWTAPRIAEHLREAFDLDVHPETVREALKRLEYSWTRPRRCLPKPTGHQERLDALYDRIDATTEDTTVLYMDETEVKRFPPLRRMWQPVGEQRAVRVPDANGAFTLYGAINRDTGVTYTRAFEKGRSDYTIQFLEGIVEQTTGRVLLVWDRATWHTSNAVHRYVDGIDRLETALLPPRTPEANPVEDLWRELKNQVAACLERSLGTLVARCREYFRSLTPEQALKTAGIH